MSDPVPSHIAAQRCQQARSAEWADTLPDCYRSEGFHEDRCSESPPVRCPPLPLRLHRSDDAVQPAWAGVLASALGLRRG